MNKEIKNSPQKTKPKFKTTRPYRDSDTHYSYIKFCFRFLVSSGKRIKNVTDRWDLVTFSSQELWQDTEFQSGKDDAKPMKKHLVKPVLVSGQGNRCHSDSTHFFVGDNPQRNYD